MAYGKAGAPRSRWVHGVRRNVNGMVVAAVSDSMAGDQSVVPVLTLNKWERGRVLKHHLGYRIDVRKHTDDELYEMIIAAVDRLGPDPFPSSNSNGEPSSDTQGEPNGEPQGDPQGEPVDVPVIQGESSGEPDTSGEPDEPPLSEPMAVPKVDPEPNGSPFATVQYVDENIGNVVSATNGALTELVGTFNVELDAVKDMVTKASSVVPSEPSVVTINVPNVDPVTFTGSHHLLSTAVARVSSGMYLMLYGPAGTGKSWLGHDVARALGVDCRVLSVNIQTQDWRVNGANTATAFIRGVARECYEHGGLLLIDEFDNGSPNFLAGMNLLLSSDTYTFADGVTVDRHPQFYVVATANTIGEGGTSQYRARQALDAATLDRFTFMRIDLDPKIEEAMAAQYVEDVSVRADLLRLVRVARQNVTDHNLRVVITPRATLDGAKMLALGEPMSSVVEDRILRGCSRDVAVKILSGTDYVDQYS